MVTIDTILNALTTLLVTLDPPGLAPLFVGLTVGMDAAQRRHVAMLGTVTAFGILAGFALVGAQLLGFLGISMGAFRIAGGILLFWIAFEMIFERRNDRKEKTSETAMTVDHIRNIAIFPLALPLISGPGAISATVLLAGSFSAPLDRAILIGILAVAMAAVFAALMIAPALDRFLGVTGRALLTRLLGVILAALSVQFAVDGIRSAFDL
ncbi:NAAT family transporter [Rhizobiales bacterium RZME27]|jgi:multiple antibiotic resistance protein|uniref:UPF0056 membrane protein n=1 Tax=Endobacterium cereale TaxID=2663029 RepID=A0A6A8A1R3_9HYPH|nr:MarC family protein [Endobacterium cereale]MEB2843454.1 MarC family protein [Endobacterium cereale]MQY44573.1 NAAT family transporter [Endobacterium cereale]